MMPEQMTCPRCGGKGNVSGTLPERLRMLREGSGELQIEVCNVVGIATSTLCRLQAGKTDKPDVFTIAKLAAHYGVTIESLLGKEE